MERQCRSDTQITVMNPRDGQIAKATPNEFGMPGHNYTQHLPVWDIRKRQRLSRISHHSLDMYRGIVSVCVILFCTAGCEVVPKQLEVNA